MPHLKTFRDFSEERVNSIVIAFGRFQPPTIGHEKLIAKVAARADGNSYRIYTSQTNDSKTNPLSYTDKIKYLRKMFPKHGRAIIEDKSIRDILQALTQIHNQRFTRVTVVAGDDRVSEFKRLLNKYDGVSAAHGFYSFVDGIFVESSGERDPDANDVSGISSTNMRRHAIANNYEDFAKGLPINFKQGRQLYNSVRAGFNLKAVKESQERPHTQLNAVSETREKFVKGSLFGVGDRVRIIESKEEGNIAELGPNFVVVKTETQKLRKWITAVEKIK